MALSMDPASHWTAASVNLEWMKTSEDELMDDRDEAREEQQDFEVAS